MRRVLGPLVVIAAMAAVFSNSGTSPSYAGRGAGAGGLSSAELLRLEQTRRTQEKQGVCATGLTSACANCRDKCLDPDLLDTIDAFFAAQNAPRENSVAHPLQVETDLQNPLRVPQKYRSGLRFVIAIVPDPIHTHMSLFFDRQIDAIEQGAQESGYLFARATMPWASKELPEAKTIDEKNERDSEAKAKEQWPGLMIFRKAEPEDSQDLENLFVFVVGETPTGGINEVQFQNSIKMMHAIQGKNTPLQQLNILGPTFSGSLYSLRELLQQEQGTPTIIHSGTVSSWETVQWFKKKIKPKEVTFRTFQESDCYQLARFVKFVNHESPRYLTGISKEFRPDQIALLAEDETAFGGTQSTPARCTCQWSGKPGEESDVLNLYFPREISQLRSAYQKDLGRGASQPANPAPRTTLPSNIGDTGNDDDSVNVYSGDQIALSQEAVMMGIASKLQEHRTEFVVLKATNPLDALFLIRYLRKAYPQGRIVIMSTDLLMAREIDDTLLQGVLEITNYPLLSGIEDEIPSSASGGTESTRLTFPSNYSTGTFNAMLSLLAYQKNCWGHTGEAQCTPPPVCETRTAESRCPDLPAAKYAGYGSPEILRPSCSYAEEVLSPPTWLTVLGRGGFWPVAILENNPAAMKQQQLVSALHAIQKSVPTSENNLSAAKSCDSASPTSDSGSKQKPARASSRFKAMPPQWRVLCCTCAAFVLIYLCLLYFGTLKSSSESVAMFAPVGNDDKAKEKDKGKNKAKNKGDSRRNRIIFIANALCLALLLLFIGPSIPWMGSVSFLATGLLLFLLACALAYRGCVELTRRGSPTLAIAWPISAFVCLVIAGVCFYPWDWAGSQFTIYRYVHTSSGVSALIPILLLLAAALWWTWYSLSGLSLIDARRPRLPNPHHKSIEGFTPAMRLRLKHVVECVERYEDEETEENQEIAGQKAAKHQESGLFELLNPLNADIRILWPAGIVVALSIVAIFSPRPVTSLEGHWFDIVYGVGVAGVFFTLVAELFRLVVAWVKFRSFLLALDRMPLRRGFEALKGQTWTSMWRFTGNSYTDLYRLVSREVEGLRHLGNVIPASGRTGEKRDQQGEDLKARILKTENEINHCAEEIDKQLGDDGKGPEEERTAEIVTNLRKLQRELALAGGQTLVYLSVKWDEETQPIRTNALPDGTHIVCECHSKSKADEEVPSGKELAEDFVCHVYVSYILSVLMRMKTLVMTVGGMYVFTLFSFASYPFEPKSFFYTLMILLLVLIVGLVGFVLAQMHKDATLSRITDTKPGELGMDFYLRLISFGAVPLFSLLAAQFPAIGSFLFSWMQPALQAFK